MLVQKRQQQNCQLKVARLNFVQLDKVLQLFARNSFVSTACITSAINQEVRLFSDNHVRIFHCFLSTWTREANKTDWEMQRNKNNNKYIDNLYTESPESWHIYRRNDDDVNHFNKFVEFNVSERAARDLSNWFQNNQFKIRTTNKNTN